MMNLVILVIFVCGAGICAGQAFECKDKIYCPVYAKKYGYCKPTGKFKDFMEEHCGNYCGFCNCKNWEYGCCRDGKTRADGPNDRGCSVKLCYDIPVDYCIEVKKNGTCHTASTQLRARLRMECPYSCGFCKHLAPIKTCHDIGYGCCWDSSSALGPDMRGCPPCSDSFPHSCKQFGVSGLCSNTGSYYRRTFLENYCPDSCGVCENCRDRAGKSKCDRWLVQGYCTDKRWESYLKGYCTKTCGHCKENGKEGGEGMIA